MRFWVGVSAAFGAGTLIGIAIGAILTEDGAKTKYQEAMASHRRAMELARNLPKPAEQPVPEEGDLVVVTGDIEEIPDYVQQVVDRTVYDPTAGDHKPADENPYHIAASAVETPVDMFVEGGINDYGVSYIEEEEYQEDDDRFKGQITIVMDEHNPTFFMDGVSINDWDERLGDSILVDFYRLVPPNATPVLYVRNHKRDEDYEVTRELP